MTETDLLATTFGHGVDDVLQVPYLHAGTPGMQQRRDLPSVGNVTVQVGVASPLVQQMMLRSAERSYDRVLEIPEGTWWTLFETAADICETWDASGRLDLHYRAVAATSGLPVRRVRKGFLGAARLLRRVRAILEAQLPHGESDWQEAGRDASSGWALAPAGRTCAVRVPDNFPTIAIEWLQVLGCRRPVVVSTSDGDVVLTTIVALSLYQAGLPADTLSVCHGDADTLWKGADQLVWPGEALPVPAVPGKVKTYHFGRSKCVVTGPPTSTEVERVTRLAFEGSGRLCTNVSGIAVVGGKDRASALGAQLARSFQTIPVRNPEDTEARVAAWVNVRDVDAVGDWIRREVAAGAEDLTAGTGSLVQKIDDYVLLRPTVLLVDPRSALFRTELPFPFVAITWVEEDEAARACRDSLIVSILGDDSFLGGSRDKLAQDLVREPSITKVFGGDSFDRGYIPTDPQEGYLVDFLFQKKALRGIEAGRTN